MENFNINTLSLADTSGTFVENEQKTEDENISQGVIIEGYTTNNANAPCDLTVTDAISKEGKPGDESEGSDKEPVYFHSSKLAKYKTSNTNGTSVENEQKGKHDDIFQEVVNIECFTTNNGNAADNLTVTEAISKKGTPADRAGNSTKEPVYFHSAKMPKDKTDDTNGTSIENEQKKEHDHLLQVVVDNECYTANNENAADNLTVTVAISKKGTSKDGAGSSDNEPVYCHTTKDKTDDTNGTNDENEQKTDHVNNMIFLCDPCFISNNKAPAKSSCKECEEMYCDLCTNVHKTQKVSRAHTISFHPELPKKSLCEPCKNDGKDIKAVFICIDCDEVQCIVCRSVHIKQKISRNHTVICSQANTSELCFLCLRRGQLATAEKYCKVCFQTLCTKCADEHRQDSSTREHKLKEISKTPEVQKEIVPKEEKMGVEMPFQSLNDSKCSQVPGKSENELRKEKSKPGKPGVVGQVYVDSVNLAWKPPKQLFEKHAYQIRYKDVSGNGKWKFHPELTASSTIALNNLKSDTKYEFQVRMVNDEMESLYSDVSDVVETNQSAAQRLMEFMYDVKKQNANIVLKKLPLRENKKARNEQAKTRKLYIGDESKTDSRERTILLVGATGTGKSTLVDGMINYVFGVNWNDPYRLTLVDLEEEELNRGEDQAVSQTQWITCYTINPLRGSRLDYKLNIIDTPGFGDTRGIERDKQIIEQIKILFSSDDETGVLFIDAVCFLVKAPDARLTPTQMYIFNSIMSLFGQDIENNFFMLVTFADGKQPPVLSALKAANLPHEQYFQFNNSSLFADNIGENEYSFSSMFWDMGCHSFQMFFDELTKMETRSLRQTKDVLQQREVIEITMENLLPKLDAGLNRVEEMRLEIRILEDYKTQIEENSDFTYTVTETEQKQIDLPDGHHVTNCLNCHVTCHKKCRFEDDEDKMKCRVMDDDGYCTECTECCFWDVHRNTPYIFKYIKVQKQKTYTEKLKKYRRAEDETMTRQKVVERMYDELFDLEDDILDLMEQINSCNNILRQIALRPDPLSVVEHIDLLIESERLGKRPGFKERISSLTQCRKKATVGDDVDRFRSCLTDTSRAITAHVNLRQKSKKRERKGKLDFFKPIVNYFKQ